MFFVPSGIMAINRLTGRCVSSVWTYIKSAIVFLMYKISLLKVAMGTALSIKDIKTVWQIFANIMVFTM